MIKKTLLLGVLFLGALSIGAKGCEVVVSPPDDPCADGDYCHRDTDDPPIPPLCEDLAGVDFGSCEMLMGWGVVNGECRPISGCGADGYRFFSSPEECEKECGGLYPVCEQISLEYRELIEENRGCEQHRDCQVLWGQCAEGLGGCYEFVNQSVSQAQLDEIGASYWEANCPGWVCDCAYIEYIPACVQGQCTGLEEEPVSECQDVTELYFGPCEMHLGWAVSKGVCQPVSGCDAAGFEFFATEEQCRMHCLTPGGSCDDGTEAMCLMPTPFCGPEEILAVQQGCYVCVNPQTCAPWGEPTCKTDGDCGPEEFCDWCGTASCPYCDDCVAACQPREPQEPRCYEDADCALTYDYCGGYDCVAYLSDSPVTDDCPVSSAPYRIADPCMNYEAVCENGQCLASPLY